MKKSILMTIIIAIMLLLTSVVNAEPYGTATASISGGKEVQTGEQVVVTISVSSDKTVLGADYTVHYDPSFLEFVKSSGTTAANATTTPGEIIVEAANASGLDDMTFTFKVIGTEGSTKVTATPTKFGAGSGEEYELEIDQISGEAVFTIPAAPQEPSTDEPTEDEPETTTTTNRDNTPKTGTVDATPVIASISVAALITLAVVAVKAIKK